MNLIKSTTKFSRHNFFFPLLSGILIGTSYIPFPPWAIFFAFVPLWLSLVNETSYKKVFLKSLVTQFTLSLIGFFWITTVATEHGHLPLPVSLIVLLFFCLTAMYYYPLSALAWLYLSKKLALSSITKVWLLATLFSLFEAYAPTLFPWNFGYTWLWARLPGYNVADVIGFQGLSTFTVFINALLLLAYLAWKENGLWKKPVAIAFALLFTINIWGFIKAKNLPEPDAEVSALLVQANIGNLEKEFARNGHGFRMNIINKFFRLTNEGLKQGPVDFVLWPETAFPSTVGPLSNKGLNQRRLFEFAKDNKLPIITGAYYQNPKTRQIANSIYYINEFGGVDLEPYKKLHLLAFGEYLPGGELVPKLKKMLPQVADFERGPGPEVTHFNGFVIGNQVCYEGLFPDFSRELALKGAQFIINLTNDSWYGPYSEPYQHLYMTFARAIEFRRPLIRSTNTGISTAILADGTVLKQSPLFSEWSQVIHVKYSKTPIETFFMKFPWTNEIFLGLFFIYIMAIRQRENGIK